jgi:predicted HTH transcriptional regulator
LISVDKRPSITVDKIIEFLMQNEQINNRQAREITGLSATRVRGVFKDMCDKDIIVPHGSNRDRFYTLK